MDEKWLEEVVDFSIKFAHRFNVEFVESAALAFTRKKIFAFVSPYFVMHGQVPSKMTDLFDESWLLIRIVKSSRLFEASVNIDADFHSKISRVIEKMLTHSDGYGKLIHKQ